MNNFSGHNKYSGVYLFNETEMSLPVSETAIKKIVTDINKYDSISIHLAEVVFVDEEEILRINNKYLGHDYVTDI
ncbi:MAG TPA: hypothetical protein VK106_04155, partial [Balneolaceae bacterium]|nr:hypothetical protein [Balneolaceae bacterium]